MAVKGKTKAEISAGFEHRLGNDAATEFGTALLEIEEIAALRLREILP
jgi:2-oxo-4-hydroxy-4-carboxy--5-ureidoimidazoline (OHCU) decarboxylase